MRRAEEGRFTTACPAEVPPPTTTTSSPQSRRAGPEDDDVEGALVDLCAQAELVRDLCDRRAAQHVVGADEHGAFLGTDAEPLEQRPALGVGVDVVPAERDQIALKQLADRERLTGRTPPDQP